MTAPDRAARAAALRAQLAVVAPNLLAFMEDMKENCDATVLYVEAPGIEQGKKVEMDGVQPYIPLSPETWPYKVGQSVGDLYKHKTQTMKKGRVKK